jgi:serine/threonine protein kinase
MEETGYLSIVSRRINHPRCLNLRGNVYRGEITRGKETLPLVVKYVPWNENGLLEASFLKRYGSGDLRIGPKFYGFNNIGRDLELIMEAAEEQVEATDKPFSDIHQILCEIGNAIQRIEEEGNTHCDIKPSNILKVENKIVIVDYGNMLSQAMYHRILRRRIIHGTHGYIPPEQYVRTPGYVPLRHDSFSFGMVMFYLGTQILPNVVLSGFARKGRIDLTRVVGEGHYHIEFTRMLHEQRRLPRKFKRLVCDAINYNPFERPSITEINERLQSL